MPTITFTEQQLESLKNILLNYDQEERKHEEYFYEGLADKIDDVVEDRAILSPHKILGVLEEVGADKTLWADFQRVWIALVDHDQKQHEIRLKLKAKATKIKADKTK
jgi:hypothetical protein